MDDKTAGELLKTLTQRHGEDVAQEALARTLTVLASGREIDNLEHYVSRAAKRVQIEQWRKQGARPEFLAVDEMPEGTARAEQHARVEARQEIERVDPALVARAVTGSPLTVTERVRRFRMIRRAAVAVAMLVMSAHRPDMFCELFRLEVEPAFAWVSIACGEARTTEEFEQCKGAVKIEGGTEEQWRTRLCGRRIANQ